MENTDSRWVHPFEKVGLGKAPYRFAGYGHKTFQAFPGAPVQVGTSCDFCGSGICNVFWVLSSDGNRFKTGCDCIYKIYKTAPRTDALFHEVRKADREMRAKRRAEQALEKRARVRESRRLVNLQRARDFLDKPENAGLESALAIDHPIVQDIAAKLQQYGDLSPRQVEFVWKLYGEAYGPAAPAEVNVPAPEGKVTVRGKVIKIAVHDGMYGQVTKMTVKVSDGRNVWLCWGTVPGSLHEVDGGGFRTSDSLRGCEVEFNASLQRGRDAHFALFKRPTKARVVKDNT
jgi:hypothetical protein